MALSALVVAGGCAFCCLLAARGAAPATEFVLTAPQPDALSEIRGREELASAAWNAPPDAVAGADGTGAEVGAVVESPILTPNLLHVACHEFDFV